MTPQTPKNLPASIRDRLLRRARESKRPFNELLQYFAMERFLYRLSKSPYSDKFVLKGALMLVAWNAPFSRPTMDIDLLGSMNNDVEVIAKAVGDICCQVVEPDGVLFDAAGVWGERIMEDSEYEGVRVRFRGQLDTARINMQIDVGFGDLVFPSTTMVSFPSLLDLSKPTLRGYSRESSIAEKFEVMVKLGILNSRMKDFFDIWLLSRQFDFDGAVLSTAIAETFARRGAHMPSVPSALKAEFATDSMKAAQWLGFVRRNRLPRHVPDLERVVTEINGFLGPLTEKLSSGVPFEAKWPASGPWSQ